MSIKLLHLPYHRNSRNYIWIYDYFASICSCCWPPSEWVGGD